MTVSYLFGCEPSSTTESSGNLVAPPGTLPFPPTAPTGSQPAPSASPSQSNTTPVPAPMPPFIDCLGNLPAPPFEPIPPDVVPNEPYPPIPTASALLDASAPLDASALLDASAPLDASTPLVDGGQHDGGPLQGDATAPAGAAAGQGGNGSGGSPGGTTR